jgi:CP family cyanate transporter-like MFS transporter
VTALVLLWLAGVGLRLTILAVPPIIPRIHVDLDLSETEVGILSGLPLTLFAFAAVLGSLLIASVGAVRTLVSGLLIAAVASALRGAAFNVAVLYATTIIMGFGIAIMQPALPPIVRDWVPHRIGFGTAVYTNGLIAGEILPVALTIPFVLSLVGDSWRLDLAAWSIPLAIIGLAIIALRPRGGDARGPASLATQRWWPDWRSAVVWQPGLMFGMGTSMYFGANAFVPDYLSNGHSDLISSTLTALNIGQIPASVLLLLVAGKIERKSWPYVVCGFLSFVAVVGIVAASGMLVVLCAGLLGFASAGTLILALALPPLLARADDVHRLSAAMLTIAYACAVIIPVVSGLAWDLTGLAGAAFVPIGACALVLIALASRVRLDREHVDAPP